MHEAIIVPIAILCIIYAKYHKGLLFIFGEIGFLYSALFRLAFKKPRKSSSKSTMPTQSVEFSFIQLLWIEIMRRVMTEYPFKYQRTAGKLMTALNLFLAKLKYQNVSFEHPSQGHKIPAIWVNGPAGYQTGDKSDVIILYFHGGGFAVGDALQWAQFYKYLVEQLNDSSDRTYRVFAVDYRLADGGKNIFPAGLDDCEAAYLHLLQHGYKPSQIIIGGDSAGGNFAITTCLKMKQSKNMAQNLPAALLLLSPSTNLYSKSDSFLLYSKYDYLSPRAKERYTANYLDITEKNTRPHEKNPLASPIYGNLRDLPPQLIIWGEVEVLADDIAAFLAASKKAGNNVSGLCEPGMVHDYMLFKQIFPDESKVAQDRIVQFIRDIVVKQAQ
jgi:monoterpene epsilon-lactone hydrolase